MEEGWADELPGGARVQSTTTKVHHVNHIQTGTRQVEKQVTEKVQTGTKTVKVGKKDLGNGYFEDVTKEEPVYEHRTRTVTETVPVYKDEPVFKDWARYEIDKWHKEREARAAGSDQSPHWPDPKLSNREREGARAEAYLATFVDDKGKTYPWKNPPQDVWKSLSVGKGYKVVTRVGAVEGLAK
jgi:hypothetical protein